MEPTYKIKRLMFCAILVISSLYGPEQCRMPKEDTDPDYSCILINYKDPLIIRNVKNNQYLGVSKYLCQSITDFAKKYDLSTKPLYIQLFTAIIDNFCCTNVDLLDNPTQKLLNPDWIADLIVSQAIKYYEDDALRGDDMSAAPSSNQKFEYHKIPVINDMLHRDAEPYVRFKKFSIYLTNCKNVFAIQDNQGAKIYFYMLRIAPCYSFAINDQTIEPHQD